MNRCGCYRTCSLNNNRETKRQNNAENAGMTGGRTHFFVVIAAAAPAAARLSAGCRGFRPSAYYRALSCSCHRGGSLSRRVRRRRHRGGSGRAGRAGCLAGAVAAAVVSVVIELHQRPARLPPLVRVWWERGSSQQRYCN